ncbi:dihydrofolate reductase [Yoonia sediminilitoris]|uniref:dihydrofolate reductase n=1 Tax=Yoonia sediminilitoris TaxID=1286148 RepID=A0A2T6KJU5_9RHOB|nr:dihydrofolate reductase [Yoonia sediminilitoris]PUB16237.1 dihydrofolate reductase [Yoonia sediminilitoris]RCW96586.1 dihydrofolate reductase [Yoonia sediminilitoris]
MITLIVAQDQSGAIGHNGAIPWDIPEDLKSFQRETLGGALIMGRNTWDSLPVKPLPRRYNIVVSGRSDVAEVVAPSVTAAVKHARDQGYDRIYGMGGAGIYKEMIPLAHRLLLTDVDLRVDAADTYFPELDLRAWTIVNERVLRAEGPRCVVREYLRCRA